MKLTTARSSNIVLNLNSSQLSLRVRRILRLGLAAISWTALMLVVLITAILGGLVSIAAVLLGGGQSFVTITLGALVIVSGGLAWLVARFVASPRKVGTAIGLLLAVLLIVGVTWALSAPQQVVFMARDLAWPGGDVREYKKYPQRLINRAPLAWHFPQNLSSQLFQAVEYKKGGKVRSASFDEFLRSTQTTSFIVIQDNAILYEAYFNGYSRDSIVTSFSIAKSFTSALVGIAIDEGYIHSLDDPIITYLPELRDKGLDGVTIRHMLSMSTGVRFVHKSEMPALIRLLPLNDEARMTAYPDFRSVALSVKPDGEAPGSGWKYNDYYPQLLGLILERTTHRTVSAYLQEKLWIPLGMEYPASWSLDKQAGGFEHMESGLNARAIDFAKFGQLYLDNGNWDGKQIISKQWVSASTAPDPSDNRPWRLSESWKEADGYYGFLWWGKVRPDGSYTYMARGGMQQQWIYVSPQDRVVIVRFGLVDGSVDSWPDVFEYLAAKIR